MEKINYELLEQRILELKLYSPKYYYYNESFWSDEEIEAYNYKAFTEEYPNKKLYYKNADDILSDHLWIYSTYYQLCTDYNAYEKGEKRLPFGDSLSNIAIRCEECHKIYELSIKNMEALTYLFDELELNDNMIIDPTVAHLFKNIQVLKRNLNIDLIKAI